MAAVETDVCIYGAHIYALSSNVDKIVHKTVMEKSTEVAPLPGIRRGDDPEINLSWLLCGADRLTGKWPNHHICSYNAPVPVKVQAMEISKALRSVPAPSWDHSLVLRIFIEFCDLVADETGKVPLGVLLGYMAITGTPATHHIHVDNLQQEIAYILPQDKEDGTSMLPDIVKTGWQLHATGDV
jgi:hypothetical protein